MSSQTLGMKPVELLPSSKRGGRGNHPIIAEVVAVCGG